MTQLLLAIAAYAVFTTVLTIIERVQDHRRERPAAVPETQGSPTVPVPRRRTPQRV